MPLRAQANGLPTLGNAGFALLLTGGPATTLEAFVFTSTLAATPIRLPGNCLIHIDLRTFLTARLAWRGRLPLPIDNDPTLAGLSLATQGVALDPK